MLLIAVAFAASGFVHAAPAQNREIRVSLFGQPCLLQGPLDERALRVVHSLSPDQLYPQRDNVLSAAPTRRAMDKLKAVTGAPPGLDRYRERLAKRLEAQLALLTAIETMRGDSKSAPLLSAAKAYLTGKKLKDFEAAVKKAEGAKTLAKTDTVDTLFDLFSEGIEADPEEEFHRSIQRMGVQYACSFESSGEEAAEPKPAN